MIDVLHFLAISFIVLGILCSLVASIGLFYFPDLYTRMHATGVVDTLGTGLILIGLMLLGGWGNSLGKLVLILLFTLLTSPTISYVLANTALKRIPASRKTTNTNPKSSEGEGTSNR
ncbi:monovalent cation/H(+) antiporter subunit G [Thalassotalea fusca]